jgi:hypothetical protein
VLEGYAFNLAQAYFFREVRLPGVPDDTGCNVPGLACLVGLAHVGLKKDWVGGGNGRAEAAKATTIRCRFIECWGALDQERFGNEGR